eukprot:TRINITY_DN4525_c0_g2_i1.p1 TRINITY_DN4525_c0_g2~~TRINITY_DN4525_c0_g2_i1.p1  ORF type:complete len:272 (-),score=41.22 TRINITY_DN4525_c0_g2_i1:40-822(-)
MAVDLAAVQTLQQKRGTFCKAFRIIGFKDLGLDGTYELRTDRMIQGTCPRLGFHPTPTYWNRDAPLDNPIFMYWQYYKDHYSVCPQYDVQRVDQYEMVRGGRIGDQAPGQAFFKWDENTWFEFDHIWDRMVPRHHISFTVLDAPPRALIPSTPTLVNVPRGRMPLSRTPTSQLITGTPNVRQPITSTPNMPQAAPRTPPRELQQVACKEEVQAETQDSANKRRRLSQPQQPQFYHAKWEEQQESGPGVPETQTPMYSPDD